MRLWFLSLSALLFTAATAQVAGPATSTAPAQAATGGNATPRAALPTASPARSPQQQPGGTGTGRTAGATAAASPVASRGATPPANATSTSVPTSSASAPPATHTVTVGGTGNKFFPDTTNVSPGDTVIFTFATSTHNLVQSDAKGGCTKSAGPSAFEYPPAGGLASQGATFSYTVPNNATNIWFYCGPHCQIGMTGGLIRGGGNSTGTVSTTSSASSTDPVPSSTGAPTSAAAAGLRAPSAAALAAAAVAAALARAGS